MMKNYVCEIVSKGFRENEESLSSGYNYKLQGGIIEQSLTKKTRNKTGSEHYFIEQFSLITDLYNTPQPPHSRDDP